MILNKIDSVYMCSRLKRELVGPIEDDQPQSADKYARWVSWHKLMSYVYRCDESPVRTFMHFYRKRPQKYRTHLVYVRTKFFQKHYGNGGTVK